MSVLSAEQVLRLWERGVAATPSARALDLLAECGVDGAPLSVGERDAAVLDLYGRLFGPVLDAVTACPSCGSALDVPVPVDLGVGTSVAGRDSVEVSVRGYDVTAVPVTAADLGALPPGVEPEAAAAWLLERCVVTATLEGEPVPPGELPDDVRAQVEDALASMDGAETRVALSCECGARWSTVLDPVPFVTAAVDRRAVRLAEDVHALARGYGWSEASILAMSPARRGLYLDVLEAAG